MYIYMGKALQIGAVHAHNNMGAILSISYFYRELAIYLLFIIEYFKSWRTFLLNCHEQPYKQE